MARNLLKGCSSGKWGVPIYSRSLFSGTGSAAGLLCSVSSRLTKFWCQLFLGWCWGDTACIFWHKGPLLLETAHLELTVLPHSEHCFTLSFGLLLILEGPLVPVLLLGDSSLSPVLCKSLTKVTASLAFWDNTSPLRVHCWEPTSDFRAPLPDFSCFSPECYSSLNLVCCWSKSTYINLCEDGDVISNP